MKILWITNTIYPYRQCVYDYVNEKHILKLVTLGGIKSEGGITHKSSISKFGYRLTIPLHILKNIRSYDYVLISGWDSLGYLSTILLASIFEIPNSIIYESTLLSRKSSNFLVKFVRRFAFKRASTILALSELSYEASIEYCNKSIKVIKSKNWFDPTNFEYIDEPDEGEDYRYIYLGRLIPQKGIERMIKAFLEIAAFNDSLWVIGEGPERERMENIYQDNRIRFLGHIKHDKISSYLRKSNALIFPTFNDVYGFPCLEAISCGLGVVVSRKAGIWRDIEDLPGVIVFDEDIASALREIKKTKKTRAEVPLNDFHFTNVLGTLESSYKLSVYLNSCS